MNRTGLIVSGTLILGMSGFSLWATNLIPEGARFATHWNINGVADGFSGRNTVLWMMPAMALGISLLLTILPKIDPRKKNLLRSSTPYLVAWIGTLVILGFVHFMLVMNAAGLINIENAEKGSDMVRWLSILLGGFFTVLGAYLGKVRPNWFLGVRTPWTLSSDLAWDKTHRLTGYLFMITGVITFLTAIVLKPDIALMVLVVGTSGSALWAVFYSWLVWKNDPKRETLVPEETE